MYVYKQYFSGKKPKRKKYDPNFFSSDETKGLINNNDTSMEIIEGNLSAKATMFPVLFGMAALITVFASLAGNCLSHSASKTDKQCIPQLSVLPFANPYIFQAGTLVTVLSGVATIWTFHSFIKQKFAVPEYEHKKWSVAVSFITGMISMVSLLLFAYAPLEIGDFSLKILGVEENLFLLMFFVCGLLHAAMTFSFMSELRSKQIVHIPSKLWYPLKLICSSLMLIFTVAFISLYVLMNQNEKFLTESLTHKKSTFLMMLYKILGYTLFHLNVMYLFLFAFDLKYVSLHLHFHPDVNYFCDLESNKAAF